MIFFISRDVVFDETCFPYETTEPTGLIAVPTPIHADDDNFEQEIVPAAQATTEPAYTDPVPVQPVAETEFLGRGHRQKRPSVKLTDFVSYNSSAPSPDKHTSADTPFIGPISVDSPAVRGNTLYPIHYYTCDDVFSAYHSVFLAAITAGEEPKTFKEAMQDERWRNSMGLEITSLEEARTWDVTTLPPGKTDLSCKWIHKIKYNADGTVERLKSRLVVCGNRQVEGEDYDETFAPVVKIATVRALFKIAAVKGWEIHQMDVQNAFLHGDLEEEVYMKMPPGFKADDPSKVCRLRKSLYGLKQAPRCWFAKLSNALLQFGFVQSCSDYTLFTFIKGNDSLRVLIYVDDLIISCNNLDMIVKFKKYLSDCFKMKDLGNAKYFLGIEVSRGKSGIFLSQRKYALDIIEDAGLLGCQPLSIPVEQNHSLLSDDGPLYENPYQFRRLVGRLVYLTITRLELCYAVHILSQVMHNPRKAHWDAAVRVVRYLKGTPGQGIMFHAEGHLQTQIYCDASWQSCPITRRSLSAYVVHLGGSPVDWKAMKQDTMSHSSAEAEYRAMAEGLKELLWMKRLLADLGVTQDSPMDMFCDNKAAMHIAKNPVFHERTKQIESDCHAVRDTVLSRLIATKYVSTTEQLADILTKALGRGSFDNLLSKLGVYDLHAPT